MSMIPNVDRSGTVPPLVRLGQEYRRRGMQAPRHISAITSEYERRGLLGPSERNTVHADPFNQIHANQQAAQRLSGYRDPSEPQIAATEHDRAKFVDDNMNVWLGELEQATVAQPGFERSHDTGLVGDVGVHVGAIKPTLDYDQRRRLWDSIGKDQFNKQREQFGKQFDVENSPEARYIRDRQQYGDLIAQNYRDQFPDATDQQVYEHMHRQLGQAGFTPSQAGQLGTVVDRRELRTDYERINATPTQIADMAYVPPLVGDFLTSVAATPFKAVGDVASIGAGIASNVLGQMGLADMQFGALGMQTLFDEGTNRLIQEDLRLGMTQEGGFARQIASQIGGVAGDIAVVLSTRNPAAATRLAAVLPGMAYFGLKEAGSQQNHVYRSLIAKGVDPAKASLIATGAGTAVGVVNALLEKIPIAHYMSPRGTNLFRRAATGFMAEGTTEGLQELSSVMIEMGVDVNDAKTWENMARIGNAVLVGGIAGGGMSFMTAGDQRRYEAQAAQGDKTAQVMIMLNEKIKTMRQKEQAENAGTNPAPPAVVDKSPGPVEKSTSAPVATGLKPTSRQDPKSLPTATRAQGWYAKTYPDAKNAQEIGSLIRDLSERLVLMDIPVNMIDATKDTVGEIDPAKVAMIYSKSDQEIADLPPIITITGQGLGDRPLQAIDGTQRTFALQKRGNDTIKGYVPQSVFEQFQAGKIAPSASPDASPDVSADTRTQGEGAAQALGIRYDGPQMGFQGEVIGHVYTDPKTGSSIMVKPDQSVEEALAKSRGIMAGEKKRVEQKSDAQDPRVRNLENLARDAIKSDDVERMKIIRERLVTARKDADNPYGVSSVKDKDTLTRSKGLISELDAAIDKSDVEAGRKKPAKEAAKQPAEATGKQAPDRGDGKPAERRTRDDARTIDRLKQRAIQAANDQDIEGLQDVRAQAQPLLRELIGLGKRGQDVENRKAVNDLLQSVDFILLELSKEQPSGTQKQAGVEASTETSEQAEAKPGEAKPSEAATQKPTEVKRVLKPEDPDRVHATARFRTGDESADRVDRPVPESKTTPAWTKQAPETPKGRVLVLNLKRDSAGASIGMRSIVDFVNNLVNVQMRVGKEQTSARSPAHFQPRYHLVRTRSGSSQYNFHEAGHGLSAILANANRKWWDSFADDLLALAAAPNSMASALSAEEGMAEWVRKLIVAPGSLPEGMDTQIGKKVQEHAPDVWSGLLDAARMYAVHDARATLSKMRSYQTDGPQPAGMVQRVHESWSYVLSHFISTEAALDERLIRPTFNTIEKLSLQTAQDFYSGIKDTDADPKLAFQTTIRTPVEISRAMDGASTKGSPEGIRVLVNEGWDAWFADEDIAGILKQAGFVVPTEDVKRGNYLYLSDKSFAEVVETIGEKDWPDFELYGWAKAALSRWEAKRLEYPGRTEGITPGDLLKMVHEHQVKHPAWEQSFRDIETYMNQMLLVSLLSGEKDIRQIIQIKSAYEAYWPLPRRVERGMFGVAGGGGATPDSGIRRAFGSALAYTSVHDAVRDRTRSALTAYYDNRLMLAVRNHGNELAKVKTLPVDVRTMAGRAMTHLRLDRKKVASLKPEETKKIVDVRKLIAETINETYTKLGIEFDPVEADQIDVVQPGYDVWRATKPNAIRVVAPFENGKREYYQVEDPVLFDMFARSRNPGPVIKFVSKLGLPVIKAWKRLITNNVAFTVFNLRRDATTAMTLGDSWQSYLPGFYAGIGVLNRITGRQPEALEASELLSRALDATGTKQHQTRAQKFRDILLEDLIPADYSKMTSIDKVLAAPGQVNAAILKPVDMFLWATGQRALSRFVEVLAREGAYSVATRKGLSTEQAQNDYDRVSGNFGAQPMSPGASSIYRLAGFLNPGVQIMYQQYARWTHPDPAVRRQSFITKMPLIAIYAAVGAALNYLLTDDEAHELMRERPDEERMRDFSVLGKLKFPFEYGAVGAIESYAWNAVEGQLLDDRVAGKAQAHAIVQRLMDLPGHPMAFAHPWLKTGLELQANYSWFFGDEIVPSTLQLAYPENPELRHYDTTPKIYQQVGKVLSVSPLKVQYLVRSAFSSQLDQAIKAVEDVINDGARIEQAADLPFIGRLFTRDPRGWRSQSVKDVGDAESKYRSLRAMAGQMAEDGDLERFTQMREEMDKLEQYHQAFKAIQRISKMVREHRKQPEPDKQLIERMEREMMRIASTVKDLVEPK